LRLPCFCSGTSWNHVRGREADAAVARGDVVRGAGAASSPAVTRPYELVVAAPAARTLEEALPEAVARAVIDLITGPLLEDP
jgi:hypothetical protein